MSFSDGIHAYPGGTRLQIRGLDRCLRDLQRTGVEVDDLKALFKKIGLTVERRARHLTPVGAKDGGTLIGTLRTSNRKDKAVISAGGRRTRTVSKQGKVSNYAPINHFTRHSKKDHFLSKAVQQTQHETLDILIDGIDHLFTTRGFDTKGT